MNNQITILLVEDDPDISDVLVEVLEQEHFRVVHTSNGQEALTYLKTNSTPHIILLDRFMPIMNGIEFRKIQVADNTLSKIPTILMSANGPSGDQISIPFTAIVTKPFSLEDFLSLLKSLLPSQS